MEVEINFSNNAPCLPLATLCINVVWCYLSASKQSLLVTGKPFNM